MLHALVFTLFGLLPAAAERPVHTTCNADLVCVKVYKDKSVRLELECHTDKPLTVQLFFTSENMKHLKPAPVRLSGPSIHPIADFQAPVGPWGFEFRTHYGYEPHKHDDSYIYTLPYPEGRAFNVAQSHTNISSHRMGNRYAVDWAMPIGTSVYAARGGQVVSIYEGSRDHVTANHIWIQHSDGTIGKYLHLDYQGAEVEEGDTVAAGDFIGRSGNTGYSAGPHLHFSVSTLGGPWVYETFDVTFATSDGAQKLVGNRAYTRPD